MADHVKQFGKSILLDHLGGLAIAFAACFAASWMMQAVGARDAAITTASLFVFVTFVLADPVGAWRGAQSWSKFRIKLGSGGLLAVVLGMAFSLADVERTILGAISPILLLPLVILPVLFMGPLVERIMSGKGPDGARLTWDDVQIGLTFPLYVTGQFLLIGAIAVGLWMVGVPWAVGLMVLSGGIVAAVVDAWLARPEDNLPDWQSVHGWQPRPDNARMAWDGLRRAFRASFPSALFLGGSAFTIVALAVSGGQGGAVSAAGLLILLAELAQIGTVVLAALVCLAVFAVVLASAMAFVIARRHGMDTRSIEAVVRQSLARLFMGGLGFVRPDTVDAAA
ncbi:hypothetical protein [Gymnodinialimonas ulvae]|uniref:hypothetical protein n=1 Tax=Gymnodinialimonas ulvae TaxID=3126504 RepID=UPI0030A0AB12